MRAPSKRSLALLGAAAIVTLAWPGPAGAQTDLGGYSGLAQAAPIRIQIYEPTIPIPTTPQIDGSIGYTKSTTETGPLSRATASYLWPGDTVGDGFGALAGSDKAQYPVQVNSRFPATSEAPAKNAGQLTDGNGMTTSSNESATRATVTGVGIAGPHTNLLGGIGKGLKNLPGLGGSKPSSTPDVPAAPVPLPVSKSLAGLVTADGMRSESNVVVGKNRITSYAHTHAAEIKLLGGLLTIGNMDLTSKTVSDGKKAVTTGHATVGDLKIGGQGIGLDEKGLDLAGPSVKLPKLPTDVTHALKMLGIEIHYLTTTRTHQDAAGSLGSQGMVISIDTAPLKNKLGLTAILGQIGDTLGKIPNIGSQLAPLAGLGPKIVLILGDVQSSATAAPAFTGPATPPVHTGGHHSGGHTGGNPGTTQGGGGTGPVDTGGTGPVDTGGTGPVDTGGTGPVDTGGTGGTGPVTTPVAEPTALSLPALGTVPRALILGGLLLALAVGWALRTAGGFLLGPGANCGYGLPSGVPDLRQR